MSYDTFTSRRSVNGIVIALLLCAATIAFCVTRYPRLVSGPNAPKLLVAVALGLLFCGYRAIRWNDPTKSTDVVTSRLGTKWGLIIGSIWVGSAFCENLLTPHPVGVTASILLGLAAFALPFLAGARGSLATQTVWGGMRVGFWSGIISGLIAFFAFVIIGFILAFVPGLPGAEVPSHPYTVSEFQQFNIADALGGALAHLFLIGAVLGSISGVVGGWCGLTFERDENTPVQKPTAN